MDVQCDAFLSKPIPGNANQLVLFLKIREGEWHMEGLRIGDQLYGAEFGLFGSVDGMTASVCQSD